MRKAAFYSLAALFGSVLSIATQPANAAAISVNSVSSLITAVNYAQPGDVITIAPGTYTISSKLSASRSGLSTSPIYVRATTPGTVVLRSTTAEQISVSGSDWVFENLVLEGACSTHTACEHAFHIVSGASRTTVRNNVIRDFNAQIKGNGVNGVFPNDVLILNNQIYNRTGRNTSNPVTPIDVVGGQRWVIRGNYIADFQKLGGDTISYAAFLKGNSSNGLMENNIVACSKKLTGGVRLGLSLGGGGTGTAYCEGGTCATEHRNGTIRNNLIMNCNDVGIYLNKAQGTKILNNLLYNTTGIDVRFSTSTADVRNNLMSGNLRNRDGGTNVQSNNITGITTTTYASWFVAPSLGNFALKSGTSFIDKGIARSDVTTDFCGYARNVGAPDLGMIEHVSGRDCPAKVKALYDRY